MNKFNYILICTALILAVLVSSINISPADSNLTDAQKMVKYIKTYNRDAKLILAYPQQKIMLNGLKKDMESQKKSILEIKKLIAKKKKKKKEDK